MVGGAILAAAVFALCRWGRLAARHRAMLWWLVSAKLIFGLLPLPALPLPVLDHGGAEIVGRAPGDGDTQVAADKTMPVNDLRGRPSGGIDNLGTAMWMLGVAILLAATLPGLLRARSWRRAGAELSEDAHRLAVARACAAVGLRREPPVLAVPGLASPLVTGLLRPHVLLPEEALARWSSEELEMVLAHEMAHVARGDLLWGLVPALARRILFFHPAAWLAEREYAVAREAACDEAVLRPGTDAFVYGRLLLHVAVPTPASAALPMSPQSMLRRRLEMIESVVRRVPAVRAGWALVVLAALALVPVRLVAKDKAGETRCLQLGGGSEETAYVITQGDSHTMCGDLADVREAERARGAGGDIVWFRVGDDRYVIRDAATAADARRYLETIAALGEQQSDVGDLQARVGDEQAEIGERQAAIGERQAKAARRNAVAAQRRLEEQLARQRESLGQVDQNRRELAEKEFRAAQAAAADSDLRMEEATERMEQLSHEMRELSARQAELGARQAKLGEEMSRQHEQAQRALSDLLDRAIRDGLAEKNR